MKQPTKADFDVEVDDSGIHVVFRPTESYFRYYLFADGRLSLPPIVRHRKTADTGDYTSSKVRAMADELAEAKVRGHRPTAEDKGRLRIEYFLTALYYHVVARYSVAAQPVFCDTQQQQ